MLTSYAKSSTQPASEPPVEPFPVRHVADVEPTSPERTWLIQQLWLHAGVGLIGGHPKTGKTFLAADLAMAVASGSDVFGHFPAMAHGPVLFYGAEDNLPALRTRFEGLAQVYERSLTSIPIFLMDVPQIRLDRQADLMRLHAAVEKVSPRLLILDPFVRMTSSIDENSANDVAAVLASLRTIQRTYDLAVLVVHHARKSPAANPMQAFRGSSDFAAWSDTNLFLSRKGKNILLSIEHRSAAAPDPLTLRLDTEPAPHFVLIDSKRHPPLFPTDALQKEIVGRLEATSRPLPTVELRRLLCKRKADVVLALEQLASRGSIVRSSKGWQLSQTLFPVPNPQIGTAGTP